MKILFYTGDEDKRAPNDFIKDPADETLEFEGTELAHLERDADKHMSATAYTEDAHFYITFDRQDLLKFIGMAVTYSHHETQAPVHMPDDKVLEILGVAVLERWASGDPINISVEGETFPEGRRAINLYRNSIVELSDNPGDIYKALGAMVVTYQCTKEYFDDK
jgi:hypothetical protein